MKKILILLFFIPLISLSQEPVKKVKELDKKNGTIEEFYVLKSDKSIKHGNYKKLAGKKLLVEGNYINGEKEVFKFYDWKGNVNLEYNYLTKEVVSFKNAETIKEVYDHNTTKLEEVRPPLSLFSDYEMRRHIAFNLMYPNEAKENGISGRAKISVYIDKNGNMVDFKIFESLNEHLDKEALRVISQLPKEWKWIPANRAGIEIESMIVIPLNFQLN